MPRWQSGGGAGTGGIYSPHGQLYNMNEMIASLFCLNRMQQHDGGGHSSNTLICAPVTALSFVTDTFLLAGQGRGLKLFDVPRKLTLVELNIFELNRIHAIVIDQRVREDGTIRALVIGGKEVAVIAVKLDQWVGQDIITPCIDTQVENCTTADLACSSQHTGTSMTGA